MAVKAQVMGPGLLTIGAVGSPVDFTAQVTKCTVKWKGKSSDSVITLSGDALAGDREYTVTLDFTVLQDLTDNGSLEWTWDHKGDQVPFTFTPSTAAGKSVSGTVVVDPLDIGGEVGKKNTSDGSWDVVGTPVLTDDLP
jgi:hypothetical protein